MLGESKTAETKLTSSTRREPKYATIFLVENGSFPSMEPKRFTISVNLSERLYSWWKVRAMPCGFGKNFKVLGFVTRYPS